MDHGKVFRFKVDIAIIDEVADNWMVREVIVLDTHALVWWTQQPELLGNDAAEAIAQSDRILIPAICFWETSLLVRKGRLSLKRGQPVDE